MGSIFSTISAFYAIHVKMTFRISETASCCCCGSCL